MSQSQNGPLNTESARETPEEQRRSVAANLEAPQPVTPPTSDNSSEQAPEAGTDWFRVAFQNIRGQQYGAAPSSQPVEAPPASAFPPPESDGSVQGSPAESGSAVRRPGQSTSGAQTSRPQKPRTGATAPRTEEEWQRAIQSEVDRRLDKFNREEALRRQREQERYLRDNDPHEYARLQREREQEQIDTYRKLQEIQAFATEQVTTYDRHVLDPIFRAIPESDRREILSAIEAGIEGRGKATQAALKALERTLIDRGRQSARQALMQDQTFIKEILTRYGGGVTEPTSAPALPSSPYSESGTINDRLRAAAAAARSR